MSILGGLFGGGDSGAGAAAKAASRAEKQRQALINQGMAGINAVYSGGSIPSYNLVQPGTAFDPKQTYLQQSRKKPGQYTPWYNPSMLHKGKHGPDPINMFSLQPELSFGGISSLFGGGNDGPPNYKGKFGKQIANQRLYTQGADQTYTGFQPDFFNQASQAYVNYALPQLEQQYKQASDTSTYGLAGSGLLRSSAADQARSNLDLTMGQQKLNIADTGRQTGMDLQKQVENSRQQAINNLYQTGDPTQAIQSAIGQASQIQAPSLIQPLSNAFSGIMNQYALQQLYPTGQQQTAPVGYGYDGYNPYNYNPYYSAPTMNFNTPSAYY